jgi:beta-lactamase regulating signal transducer with metallopeptidase domain/ankyrin repeat protein
MTMASDWLFLLLRANLAIGAAILMVLVLRRPMRKLFGARAAYGLWLIAPLAALSVLPPARTITVAAPSSSPAVAARGMAAALAPRPTPSQVSAKRTAPDLPLADALLAAWGLVALLAIVVQVERQRRFVRSLGQLSGEAGLYHAERDGIGPAVIGAFAPKVVLPADFAMRFTAEEQALILAHERAHLSTGDAQINALTTALQCLFWFNPLVHLGANRLRIDQEIACDAAVLLRFPVARRVYGEAMLKTQLAPFAPPLGCHWPASAHTPLKERFAMLKQHTHGRARRLTGAGAVVALAVGAGFAAWAAQPAQIVQVSGKISRHDAARNRISPLYKAVQDGDIGQARALITTGAKVDFKARGDGTPLIVAARDGRADLVTLLLDNGANPNLSVRGDGAPLLAATQAGHGDIARTLVERGADVDTYVRGDSTPLINAIRTGDLRTIGYLIDKGADVNSPSPGDGSPLIEAVHTGRAAVIDLLLAKGANAAMPVQGDGDPLIAAAASGRLDLVKTLVEHGASVESFVYGDETPLINAAQSGDLATVAYLIDKGADVNRAVPANRGEMRSPLGEATKFGHRAVIDYLKAKGARA